MELFYLVKSRFLIIKNSLVSYARESYIKLILILLFGSLFLTGEYLFFLRIFHYFEELPFNVGNLLLIQMFNMIFLTFFSMLLFSNIITSISAIYLSKDLEFLRATPLRIANIFVLKFFQTMGNSSWVIFLFAFPIFVASGQMEEVSSVFYLQVLAIFIPFLMIPGSIGILATVLLMRFSPAKKAHQVLSFLGLVFGTTMVIFIRFLKPERLLKDVSDAVVIQFMESLKVPDYRFLPSTWITKAYLASLGNEDFSFSFYFLLLLAAAIATFSITLWISSVLYKNTWVEIKETNKVASGDKMPLSEWMQELYIRLFPRDQKPLWRKDIKSFWREANQWTQIFMLGALMVLYIYNIRNLPLDTIFLKNLVSLLNIALAGFVLAAVSLRFTYAGISLEGRAFWIIHSSPVKPKTLIIQKFLFHLIPLVVLAEALVITSNYFLGADGHLMLVSGGTILLITLGLTGLGTGLGAKYPKFSYENPNEIGTSVGGVMFMLISLGFIGLVILLEARPLYYHMASKLKFIPPPGKGVLLYYVLVLILSLAMAVIPLLLGIRALKTKEI